MVQEKYVQEDEIDLSKVLRMLWKKKLTIAFFTTIVTFVSVVYVFSMPTIYEAKVLFEIGEYKLDNNDNNNKIQLDNASQLTKKLEVLFVNKITEGEKSAVITSVSVPKGVSNFIEVRAEGLSSQFVLQKIDELKKYIQYEHQKILNDIKQRRELEIQNIDVKISNIQNKEMILLDKKLELQNKNLEEYTRILKSTDENLKNIQNVSPSLAALQLMQKRDLSNFILSLNTQILEMESRRDELETTVINKLLEDKNLLHSMLLPHNYKNTEIVGDIVISNSSTESKKLLIIMVSSLIGFILSMFIVFFMQFIQNFRGEKND